MSIGTPASIAVDWGTTRMRAWLLDRAGAVLGTIEAETGVQSVPPGGFPAALQEVCGPWLDQDPGLPVLMAGMVGSRNGWHEAPYAPCPCGPVDLATKLALVRDAPGSVRIVPGVDCRWPDGGYDVMRGEEVQAIGAGVDDGLLCLPGTHSKWIEIREGRILRFATFATGELYAAVTASFVGRLAETPEDTGAGLPAGARASTFKGGLTRALFQARAQVLGGDLGPRAVRPFLSSLLIGHEIAGACELFGRPATVHLVAGPPQREIYRVALERRGIEVETVDPAAAVLAGLARLSAEH